MPPAPICFQSRFRIDLRVALHLERVVGVLHVLLGVVPRADAERGRPRRPAARRPARWSAPPSAHPSCCRSPAGASSPPTPRPPWSVYTPMRSNCAVDVGLDGAAAVPGDVLQSRRRPPVPCRSAASWPASARPAGRRTPPPRRRCRRWCRSWCSAAPTAGRSAVTVMRAVRSSTRSHLRRPSPPTAARRRARAQMSSGGSFAARSRDGFPGAAVVVGGGAPEIGPRPALEQRHALVAVRR